MYILQLLMYCLGIQRFISFAEHTDSTSEMAAFWIYILCIPLRNVYMETNQLLFIVSGIHTLLSAPTLRNSTTKAHCSLFWEVASFSSGFKLKCSLFICHSCLMCFYWKGRDRSTFDMQIPCSRSGCSLHSRECVWHGLIMTNGLSLWK